MICPHCGRDSDTNNYVQNFVYGQPLAAAAGHQTLVFTAAVAAANPLPVTGFMTLFNVNGCAAQPLGTFIKV